jgi:AraC family transcriptional regulator, positive regulator of tynA and feaB
MCCKVQLHSDVAALNNPSHKMETIVQQSCDSLGALQLGYGEWRAFLHSFCGCSSEGIKSDAFNGWVRALAGSGLVAADIGGNAPRIVRTQQDVRLDGLEHYSMIFQVAGRSVMTQKDRVVRLAAGDVVIADAGRPATCFLDDNSAQWLVLHLPRQSLVSHLGFEPEGGSGRGGTVARLLFDVVRDALKGDGPPFSPADSYMQLAVYDLVGALFASSDPWPVSRHTDKLFAHIRRLIEDRFSEPDLGPSEVAAEAGVSLRYLQKLFTERGSTFSQFIYSLRLDHAARLLHRRAAVGTRQPLSEIVYACGFRDYTHFSRRFRDQFGYPPGRRAGDYGQRTGD